MKRNWFEIVEYFLGFLALACFILMFYFAIFSKILSPCPFQVDSLNASFLIVFGVIFVSCELLWALTPVGFLNDTLKSRFWFALVGVICGAGAFYFWTIVAKTGNPCPKDQLNELANKFLVVFSLILPIWFVFLGLFKGLEALKKR